MLMGSNLFQDRPSFVRRYFYFILLFFAFCCDRVIDLSGFSHSIGNEGSTFLRVVFFVCL